MNSTPFTFLTFKTNNEETAQTCPWNGSKIKHPITEPVKRHIKQQQVLNSSFYYCLILSKFLWAERKNLYSYKAANPPPSKTSIVSVFEDSER